MFFKSKFLSWFFILKLILACSVGFATEKDTSLVEEEEGTIDVSEASEAFGHFIGRQLELVEFDFDIDRVVQGIRDAVAGKESPMTDSDCLQTISAKQEEAFLERSQKNLDAADQFMIDNAKNEHIIEVEKNKLQYKIERTGTGDVVEDHSSPRIRYSGSLIDGKVFVVSQEEELISLDDIAIAGFQKAIIGMQEGERRIVYIHPTYGYGATQWHHLPPNSLLIFDIELLKAHDSSEQECSLSSIPEKQMEDIDIPVHNDLSNCR